MTTTFIKTPSAELRVAGENGKLSIMVKGLAVSHGRLQKILKTVEASVTPETLQKMVELKGDWWLDELERRQDPTYVRHRLETLVKRFGTMQNMRVLDMGSGGGSSSFMLLDLGAAQVHGVEPDAKLVGLAKLRAQDEGLADRATFVQVDDTSKLPFEDGRFDAVVFNAVLEHIPPANRAAILKDAWRCLKPGGLMVFTETPNRAFPYDGHTTGLPLVPWLPLSLSCPLAKSLSRHVPRGQTKDAYVSQGLVGGSYWQIKKALPDAICLNLQGGDAKWKCDLKKSGPVMRAYLSLAEWKCRLFGWPLNAWMPMMDLVFKKKQ